MKERLAKDAAANPRGPSARPGEGQLAVPSSLAPDGHAHLSYGEEAVAQVLAGLGESVVGNLVPACTVLPQSAAVHETPTEREGLSQALPGWHRWKATCCAAAEGSERSPGRALQRSEFVTHPLPPRHSRLGRHLCRQRLCHRRIMPDFSMAARASRPWQMPAQQPRPSRALLQPSPLPENRACDPGTVQCPMGAACVLEAYSVGIIAAVLVGVALLLGCW